MTEDSEKRFWAGGLEKISWQVGIDEGIEAGVRAERDRVIGLLKSLIPDDCWHDAPCDCHVIQRSLELIEGEQND